MVLFHFDGSERLRQQVAAHGVTLCPESDEAEFGRLLPEVEVLWHVLKPVSAEVIGRAPKLRLIQKIGTGVNTIDLEAARTRGIAVCNLPQTNSRAVAEMTLALMLACLRRLPQLDELVRKGDWHGAARLQDQLSELGGRTVGLIGYGAVPRLLHPVLEALGARVLYWSRSRKNCELEALLATADVVSLHLPLTPQTQGLLDPARMKPGSILINTARGGLVREEALLASLRNGHLAAAGLDVFAEEPVAAGHPLLAEPSVVVSPHVAWLTEETLARSIGAALENVRLLRAGMALRNRVA